MLQRRTASNGVVYYASTLLEAIGVPHGFSTRIGGMSPAPFDSLNLGNPNRCDIQDDYERIWENYRLLQEAVGCAGRELLRVHQVHGNVVVRAHAGQAFDKAQKADVIVGDDPSSAMSVRIADCVPVLMASSDGRSVAAVHAGWRGVIADVVPASLAAMIESAGSNGMSDLIAAIGPCIGEEAFEVGPEVVDEFARVFGSNAPARRSADGKGRVDLRGAVRIQLLEAGVKPDHIDETDRCTFRNADEFFSHRRDRGVTGRMAAVISPRAHR